MLATSGIVGIVPIREVPTGANDRFVSGDDAGAAASAEGNNPDPPVFTRLSGGGAALRAEAISAASVLVTACRNDQFLSPTDVCTLPNKACVAEAVGRNTVSVCRPIVNVIRRGATASRLPK
jgi:hypothetical protein